MKEVDKLLPKALKTYDDILSGENVTALQKATADTLTMDLGGYRAPTKTISKSSHLHLTVEEIEAFKERGLEAARSAGLIIDVKHETIKEVQDDTSGSSDS